MTIGERIKLRREELGLTQEELAKKVGYKSRSSINKIELSRDLPLNKISLMAKALETTPSYLVGWSDDSDLPEIKKMDNKTRAEILEYYIENGDLEIVIEKKMPQDKTEAIEVATAYLNCGEAEKKIIRRALGIKDKEE